MRRIIGIIAVLAIAGCAAQGFSPASGGRALSWNSFPTEDYEPLRGRITDVTYELRIWKGYAPLRDHRAPETLVYSRSGLSHPLHDVEDALSTHSAYVWSVRARFKLDGRPRATPWATERGWSRTAALPELDFAPLHLR